MYNTLQDIQASRPSLNGERWYFYEEVYRSTGETEYRVNKARKVEMPRINDYIARSVFFLYPSKVAAEKNKRSGGTGFRVCVASEKHIGFSHFYGVANVHVVHASKEPSPVIRDSNAVRLHPAEPYMAGNREILQLRPEQWIAHKDPTVDLAIVSLGGFPTNSILLGGIPSFTLLTHEVVRVFDIGLGDDVYMVGRFIHHDGKYFNQPSVRSGIISMMPDRIEMEEGSPPEEGFLIEMRSIGGFSGSPVMWKLPLFDTKISLERNVDKEASKNVIVGPWLLGIECAKFNFYDPVLRNGNETGELVKSNMGQSFVIPAWKLTELLNEPEFVMARKEEDRKISERIDKAATAGKAERTSGVSEQPEYETTFETFDDMLKRASRKVSESKGSNKNRDH